MTIEQQLRLEALRIAAGVCVDDERLVQEAERIYQWLLNGQTAEQG